MTSSASPAPRSGEWSWADRGVVWLAQGLGTGQSPVAPGTMGSVLGLGWFALLAWSGSTWFLVAATLAGCVMAVPVCTRAERLLGRKDPGCVVLDEIVALPVCYLGIWLEDVAKTGLRPGVSEFFLPPGLAWLAAGFVVFRLLDALKPPPIGACQNLPAGWGIVADDVVAAFITGLVLAGARQVLVQG
jgi:phosphatidylglycerophosphatase A